MPEKIIVQGLEETLRTLDQMKIELVQKAIRPALEAASVPAIQALAAKTPVRSGELLHHINVKIRVSQSEKGGIATIGFPGMEHLVRWLEYGHREVGHAPKHKDEGTVSPIPFVRESEEQSATAVVEAFKAYLDGFINAVNQKLKKVA